MDAPSSNAPRRTRLWAVVLLLAALVGQAVLIAWYARNNVPHRVLKLEYITWPLYAIELALLTVARIPVRQALVGVILTGAALQICAIQNAPISSDDDFRYVWDARVQVHGIDPYRYPPSAPELARLRDPFLFPGKPPCNQFTGGCTVINRPDGRTIYPPVAEAAFDTIYLLSFGDTGQHLPLQAAAALGTVLVGLLLARRGPPAWQVALWSWCPTTVIELSNNAHIDWLGVLLAVLAVQAYASRRFAWAGVLLGAATAVKLYPALVGAAMLRRRPVTVLVTSVAFFLLTYVPHVAAVGAKVIGYLPTYFQEEHYSNGGRFLLFRGLFSANVTQAVVALLLAGVAAAVVLRSDPDRPERGAAVMVGAAFILVSPDQSWYSVLLLVVAAMTGWIEILPFVFVSAVIYLNNADYGLHLDQNALQWRLALAGAVTVFLIRLFLRRTGRLTSAPVGEEALQ